MRRIVIGTRGSELARWQARHVAGRIGDLVPGCEIELRIIRTTGDRLGERPLANVGGKGLFLKEIEEALAAGEIDCAVHSLKDVPADVAPGLRIGAVLERADPGDVLCLARDEAGSARGAVGGNSGGPLWDTAGGATRDNAGGAVRRDPVGRGRGIADGPAAGVGAAAIGAAKVLRRLPEQARIGTGSLRRRGQLLALRRDLRVEPIRGNVDTRLRKLDAGEVDAIVVAAAGLARLGLTDRAMARFTFDEMLPAPGQGALAVEVRRGDEVMNRLAARLNDDAARRATDAERSLMRALGGSCRVPLAAYADGGAEVVHLIGLVGDGEGAVARADGRDSDPTAVGELVAERLRERGADELLARVLATER